MRIASSLRRLLRWLGVGLLALYLVCACVILAVRYLVLPTIDDHRADIERAASRALETPVRIGSITAHWRGLNPELELHDVKVLDAKGATALSLPQVDAVVSWRSALSFTPRMVRLTLSDAALDIRRDAAGRVWVAGLPVDDDGPREDESAVARWLVAQQQIVVRNARLRWTDELRQAPPLEVSRLNVVGRNDGHRHRLAVRATVPDALGGSVDLRADFSHPWFTTRPADLSQWVGDAYLNLPRADLAAWRAWVDLPADVRSGQGSLTAWLGMTRGRVTRLTADLDLRDVDAAAQPDAPRLQLARARGRVEVERTRREDRVVLRNAGAVLRDGPALLPGDVSLRRVHPGGERPAGGELNVERVDVAALAALAERLPLSPAALARLREMAPRGNVRSLALSWTGERPGVDTVQARGRFDDLAANPAPVPTGRDHAEPQRPGVERLSGDFALNGRSLRLGIDSRAPVLSFPGVFAEPVLPLESLQATVRLSWPADGPLRADIDDARFVHARVAGHARGSWHAGGRRPSGVLDLAGGLDYADARDVSRFLPIEINPDVRNWVRRALLAGRIADAEFRVRGDLDDFPFAKPGSGEFRIHGKVNDVSLDYGAQNGKPSPWPRLEGVTGTVTFQGNGMQVAAERAQIRPAGVAPVPLGRTVARIDDMGRHATLQVEGTPSGPGASFLRFVATSPLQQMMGGFLDDAQIAGDLRMPLALSIPLDDADRTTVKGTIEFTNNRVVLMRALPPLERATGRLQFTEQGLTVPGIDASMLGGPVTLDGDAPVDGRSRLRMRGTVSAAALAAWRGVPVLKRLRGDARYDATVAFTQDGAVDLRIASDLAGLAMDLPAPLAKAVGTAMPLQVDWQRRRGQQDAVREQFAARLGEVLDTTLEGQGDGRVSRGIVRLHAPAPASGTLPLPANGLVFDVALPQIELDPWNALLADVTAPSDPAAAAGGAAPVLAAAGDVAAATHAAAARGAARCVGDATSNAAGSVVVQVRTPLLVAQGRRLTGVDVRARCEDADPRSWRVQVQSNNLAGDVVWRQGENGAASQIQARLARLVIEEDPNGSTGSVFDRDSVADMPEVDLQATQFVLYGRDLGELSVKASTEAGGREWHMSRLLLRNPDAELVGTGVWRVDPSAQGSGRRRMTLDAALTMHDAGRFLDRLKLAGTMRGGSGTLTGRVSWAGKPYSLDIPTLEGKLTMALEKGQFLKAEPGIAKLLGVMSLQALPRRITLDFRDVFSEGFAYDSILANAAIQNGVLRTDDFKMRGVAATVVMGGKVDLDRETQNLRVVVVPEVNAGAASILYGLAINPAIGLGTFLAQWVLRDPLNHAFTFEYQVDGSWAEPQVERVKREQGPAPVAP